MDPEVFFGLLGSLGLAAASGVRVFVAFFVVSLFAYSGSFVPAANFAWLGSIPAVATLAVIACAEIAVHYFVRLDKSLEPVATSLSMVGGTFLVALRLVDANIWFQWPIALLAGAGVAGVTQLFAAGIRLKPAVAGSNARSTVATVETLVVIAISILSFLLPPFTGGVVIAFTMYAVRGIFRSAN